MTRPHGPRSTNGFIDHFVVVDDGAYDDIRAMLATIQAAGWTSLTQTAVDRTGLGRSTRQWSADEG